MRVESHGRSRKARCQSGLSLVELSLALVVLGIALLVAVQYGVRSAQRHSAAQSLRVMERAEAAVLAFAFMRARLPCPSVDTRGVESCDGQLRGYLPYRTLGLPDPAAGAVRFRLDSLQLASRGAGGFEVLVPAVGGDGDDLAPTPVRLQTLAGTENDSMPDFCAALWTKSGPGDAGRVIGNRAAFELQVPDQPGQQAWLNGAGRAVRTVPRSKMAHVLGCAGLLPAAGRAHFNAALEAAVMRRTLEDYQAQFALASGLYEWDFAQSNWFLANSGFSALKATVKLLIARSAWLASLKVSPEPATAMGLAAAVLTTASLHTAVYASTVARGAGNLANAQVTSGELAVLVGEAQALEQEVAGHAAANAAGFFFLQQQAWSPEQAAVYLDSLGTSSAPRPADAGIDRLGQEARDYLAHIRGH